MSVVICARQKNKKTVCVSTNPMDYSFCFHFWTSTAVCEISGRPIDNVYVKSSWSMSNFQNVVYNVQ
jgi:hypothetical protein